LLDWANVQLRLQAGIRPLVEAKGTGQFRIALYAILEDLLEQPIQFRIAGRGGRGRGLRSGCSRGERNDGGCSL
jgi:hypothetical protein